MEEIIIREIPLPTSVRAFTLPDAQGDYNIYINSRLCLSQKKESLLHEKRHIENGDFFKDEKATVIENMLLHSIK